MFAFIITTGILLVIVYQDIRPAWTKGPEKAVLISAAFLLAGYVILALGSFEIYLPSPLKPLELLVRNLVNIGH